MTSASQACGSISFNFAVPIREYMAAARCPPRSDPAKSHDFLPRATPRNDLSAAAYSGVIRPLIPKVFGHPFRFYPATDSGASGHPCDVLLRGNL